MESPIYKPQSISPLQPKDFMYKHKDMPLISLVLSFIFYPKVNTYASIHKDPRLETFCDMAKLSCFPNFQFLSFVFLKILVDIGLFAWMLALDGIFIQGELLQPTDYILFAFGILCPSYIKNNLQLHRLFCSQFLTSNLPQLFLNIASLLIYGSYFEKLIGGKLKCLLFYLIAGAAGGVFQCNLGGAYSVVNSSDGNILFIVVVFINLCEEWHLINYPGSGKYQMIGLLLLGIYFNIWFGIVYSKISWISQLGSMFVATLLGIGWGQNSKLRSKKLFAPIRTTCCVLLVLYFLANLFVLYFLKQISILGIQ